MSRPAFPKTLCSLPRLFASCYALLALSVRLVASQPNPQQMLSLSIASTEADWKAAPQFSYVERDEDSKGGITTSRTYQVLMLDGSPYARLLAVDNKPLSAAQNALENAKLQKEMARRANESPRERARRLAQYRKKRARMFVLLREMSRAFQFTLTGEQKLDNREVYVLQALPRPGYRPQSRETEILTGMKGTLWIDKDTYRWVQVEADAVKPVWMGWFIAEVLPGTRFLLQQIPVTPTLWLPEHFSFEARARILWWQKNFTHSETYQDYHFSGLSRR